MNSPTCYDELTNEWFTKPLHGGFITYTQFASCKEELLRLLDGYIKNLGDKVLPYAVEIKVRPCETEPI